MSFHTGNFEGNTTKMIKAIEEAKLQQSDLIVFSELATCGYPPRDFLEFKDFINEAEKSVKTIAEHCMGIAAIVGSQKINPIIAGKDLYNAAYFLEEGKIKQIVDKTLLPNYDIFDEYRYFEPNKTFQIVNFNGFKIALTICEDLWNLNDNPMYVTTPLDNLIKLEPDFVINIAASPFSKTQIEERRNILIGNAKKYQLPIFYINHIGAQTHLIFDGGSCVINQDGSIIDALNSFKEDQKSYTINKSSGIKGEEIMEDRNMITQERYKNIFELRKVKIDYFLHTMKQKAKHFLLLRYEDLRDDYENTLHSIKTQFTTPDYLTVYVE